MKGLYCGNNRIYNKFSRFIILCYDLQKVSYLFACVKMVFQSQINTLYDFYGNFIKQSPNEYKLVD